MRKKHGSRAPHSQILLKFATPSPKCPRKVCSFLFLFLFPFFSPSYFGGAIAPHRPHGYATAIAAVVSLADTHYSIIILSLGDDFNRSVSYSCEHTSSFLSWVPSIISNTTPSPPKKEGELPLGLQPVCLLYPFRLIAQPRFSGVRLGLGFYFRNLV